MAKSKPFNTTPYSVFVNRYREFGVDRTSSVKVTLTAYCKDRYVSKYQAKIFIKKGWLAVTKHGRNLWVEELCKDEIDEYLGIS